MLPSKSWTEPARWTARLRGDDGSASLEFVAAGLILLLPVVYLVLVLSSVQAGAFAAEAAARQAARLFVQAESVEAAQAVADRAIQFALADYGVDRDDASVAVTCVPAACLEPGAIVTVQVTVSVPLPARAAGAAGRLPARGDARGHRRAARLAIRHGMMHRLRTSRRRLDPAARDLLRLPVPRTRAHGRRRHLALPRAEAAVHGRGWRGARRRGGVRPRRDRSRVRPARTPRWSRRMSRPPSPPTSPRAPTASSRSPSSTRQRWMTRARRSPCPRTGVRRCCPSSCPDGFRIEVTAVGRTVFF